MAHAKISTSICVLVQMIVFLIYITKFKTDVQNSIFYPRWLANYVDFSVAGSTLMVAGLILNVVFYVAFLGRKVFVQVGALLILIGMVLLTIGAFYEMDQSGYRFDYQMAMWLIAFAGGSLVLWENREHAN